ncbi:MAG: hypothetical protein WD428_00540 [Gaiellaceae bacterium]
MPELELALTQIGRELDLPETPDLAPRVRERLAAGSRPRRRLVLAFATVAVAVGAAMAVPQSRAAILEFFGLRGVEIQRVEELPPVPRQTTLDLGEELALEQAAARAGFEVVIPEELGEPDHVYYLDFPLGGMVSFVYGDTQEPRALFTQFRATVRESIFKKVLENTQIEPLSIDGQPGFWLTGEPHVFYYVDAQGMFDDENIRLAGDVLLWERGQLTLRLEGDLSKADAAEIARSVRPVGE